MTKLATVSSACFFLYLQAFSYFPIIKGNGPRREIHYANGSVIGTYSYNDLSGNPIAVKYYADASGYGVELNSYKTLKLDESSPTQSLLERPNPTFNYNMKPVEPLLELASEILSFDNKLQKDATTTDANKDTGIINHLENIAKLTKMSTPDYETYYQNEVKAPKQCEKDKVTVYLTKERRKTRSVLRNNYTLENSITHCK